MAMDDSDDDDVRQDRFHPSHSIPDAAYPDDSSYRPGTGDGVGGASHSLHHHHAFATASTASPSVNSHSHSQSHRHQEAWRPYDIPNSPPPPYDPRQAPSAYIVIPFNAAAALHQLSHSKTTADTRTPEMVPLQPIPTSTSLQQQQTAEPAETTSPSVLTQNSSHVEGAGKPEDAAREAHRLKRRRVKICVIIVVTLVTLFGAAVVLGVCLGIKNRIVTVVTF